METRLAPCWKGRVRLTGSDGIAQELRTDCEDGWHDWVVHQDRPESLGEVPSCQVIRRLKELGERLYPALRCGPGEARLSGSLRRTVAVRVFGLPFNGEERILVWPDCGRFWWVGPATGTTPRYLRRLTPSSAHQAIENAARLTGVTLVSVEFLGGRFEINWRAQGSHYVSLVDPHLNVIRAGFCLSQTDAAHDLTSLFSLMQRDAPPYWP